MPELRSVALWAMHGGLWIHDERGLWLAVVIVATLSISISDILRRKVRNALVLVVSVSALAAWSLHVGSWGLLCSLSAMALAFLICLPLYVFGMVGAADVKVMAAYGAWVGLGGLASFCLLSAIFAGLLSLVALCGMEREHKMATLWGCLSPNDALFRARASKQTMPLTVALSGAAIAVLLGRF